MLTLLQKSPPPATIVDTGILYHDSNNASPDRQIVAVPMWIAAGSCTARSQ